MQSINVSGSVARSSGPIGREVIQIGDRWVCRVYDQTGTLSVTYGDDVVGEVGIGASGDDALAWLAGVL